MIIKLTINDSASVDDVKATGAKDLLEIINRELGMKVEKVSIREITSGNIVLRNSGEKYEYFSSDYEI